MTRLLSFLLTTLSCATTSVAFSLVPHSSRTFVERSSSLQAAESEVSFGDLDGKNVRIGIIRTRWNNEHVTNLVTGIRSALKECKVEEDNVFETEVPGSFELPLAAKFLAMSGTVDAIICAGVLIKGDTMHFEYIADTVAKGIMNVGIQTSTPIIFGVLTCLNEEQVKKRSSGNSNHGYDWGKTAVEMACLKQDATGRGASAGKLGAMGFSTPSEAEAEKASEKKTKVPGFF